MSQLQVPCEYGPNPTENIVVDATDGDVYVDLRRVLIEPDDKALALALSTREARSLAAALLHFANEIEAGRA